MEGKPITTFLITALILWGVYLWRQGRLGQVQMLPHPKEAAASLTPGPAFVGPPAPVSSGSHLSPILPMMPGWMGGSPPVLPPVTGYSGGLPQ